MIDRINASIDLYSHLRLEVTLQGQSRARPRGRAAAAEEAVPAQAETTLQLETDERRRARRPEEEGGTVVQFEQSSTADARNSGYGGTAEEVVPALEASVLPSDPRMAYVAKLYGRSGRIGGGGYPSVVGTRLNAVA